MVDDDKHFLDIYASRLEREGWKVMTASDGEKGLKFARKDKPNLIILDIVMPVHDGFETLAELKNDPILQNIPVFMLSTFSSSEYIKKALDGGAIEYLVKGHINPGELVKKIYGIISK